jgi:hypothetical protein
MDRLNQESNWRKSSRSNANGTDCVEVAEVEGDIRHAQVDR